MDMIKIDYRNENERQSILVGRTLIEKQDRNEEGCLRDKITNSTCSPPNRPKPSPSRDVSFPAPKKIRFDQYVMKRSGDNRPHISSPIPRILSQHAPTVSSSDQRSYRSVVA